MGSSQGERGPTSLKIKEEEGGCMRGLSRSDSYQNEVSPERDNGELIGGVGLGKKSFQEGVLQQAMEGKKKERKEKERKISSVVVWLQVKEWMRVVVLVVVGGNIQ
ncbi:hypothetical protein AAC387_Pa01g2443 [Persea americana]